MYKFLENEDRFNLDHLLSFFRKTDDKQILRIPPPDFNLLSSKTKAPFNPELSRNYKEMEKLLEIEDITINDEEKMENEEAYKSLKGEMKELIHFWKTISCKPV